MAKRKGGTIVAPTGDRKTWGLRVTAYGKRHWVPLGTTEAGWNRERAADKLAAIRDQIREGTWRPDEPKVAQWQDVPTFQEAAEAWYAKGLARWAERTAEYSRYMLERHLLPHFADVPVDRVGYPQVEDYTTAKQLEGRIAAKQINQTLTTLAAVLRDAARRHGLRGIAEAASDPAMKLPTTTTAQPFLRPEQIRTFLESASDDFRPVVAVLLGAGLRIGEACRLNWQDVDLKTGTLTVVESKTDSGAGRIVDLPGGLQYELADWFARTPRSKPTDPVLINQLPDRKTGIRERMRRRNAVDRVKATIKKANPRLEELGIAPIDSGLANHGQRRTWATMRSLNNEPRARIKRQGGWKTMDLLDDWYEQATERVERLPEVHQKHYEWSLKWSKVGAVDDIPAIDMPGRSSQAVTEAHKMVVKPSKSGALKVAQR